MKVVIGLGNPGREYSGTRHNIGFMVLSEFARRLSQPTNKKRFKSDIVEGLLHSEKTILVAPQTYMNLSGHAVREVKQWYHLENQNLLVVFDDMDLPFGTLRMRPSGSAGGHNGLRSIIEQLGGDAIPRLRIGIGRGRSSATGHVLSRFSSEEEAELPELIAQACDAIQTWTERGIISAMKASNAKQDAPDPA